MYASRVASGLRSAFSSSSRETDSEAMGNEGEVRLNIILVSDSLAKSRTVALSQTQVPLIAFGILLSGFFLAMATYVVTMKFAVDLRNPYLPTLLAALHDDDAKRTAAELKDNRSSRAAKAGQLQ